MEEHRKPITYAQFKTGLTFTDVRRMLWTGGDAPDKWRQKRRGSVLGFWRQLKQDMWAEFCARNPELVAE